MLRAGQGVARTLRSASRTRGFSSESPATAVGVNVLKGEADPLLRPESEYPTWLWELTQPQPVLSQLRKAGMDGLDLAQQQRRLKLENREAIRDRNFSKAKKQ